jgi:hypothetical protein
MPDDARYYLRRVYEARRDNTIKDYFEHHHRPMTQMYEKALAVGCKADALGWALPLATIEMWMYASQSEMNKNRQLAIHAAERFQWIEAHGGEEILGNLLFQNVRALTDSSIYNRIELELDDRLKELETREALRNRGALGRIDEILKRCPYDEGLLRNKVVYTALCEDASSGMPSCRAAVDELCTRVSEGYRDPHYAHSPFRPLYEDVIVRKKMQTIFREHFAKSPEGSRRRSEKKEVT